MLVWLALLVVVGCCPVHAHPHHPVLHTTCGDVRGRERTVDGRHAHYFMTVPYAQSTGGRNRFQLPHRVGAWNGTVDGTRESTCYSVYYQARDEEEATTESEDCLHMNVVLPVDEKGQRREGALPTLVWIHGGSFAFGDRAAYHTDPIIDHFSSKSIIFISIEYRQGLWGFLSHPSIPANLGLHDILSALRFVHENAGLWGVDTRRITLAGESSGAALVGLLAVSPSATGLFTSVFEVSGSPLAAWAVRSSNTAHMTERWYEMTVWAYTFFTPVIDTHMGPLSLLPSPAAASPARLPLLLSTSDEMMTLAWMLVRERHTLHSLIQLIGDVDNEPGIVGDVMRQSIAAHSNQTKQDRDTRQIMDFINARVFFAPAYAEARKYAAANNTVYFLDMNIFDQDAFEYRRGSPHCAELATLFRNVWLAPVAFLNKGADGYFFNHHQPAFATIYGNIIADFVTNQTVSQLTAFSSTLSTGNVVSENGVRTRWMEAHENAWRTWTWTIPCWRAVSHILEL